ncbi:MAG: dienelactone hydrolase family protein [Pseudomonadota bacterium]
MRRLLAIAFLILLGRSAAAQSVHFPGVSVGNSPAGPEITGWMYRPAGTGPFPAIILAHSCSGVGRHTETWGKRLASWGYLVLAPDSFGPRGEKSVCTKGGVVSGTMRVADIAGALAFLAAQPDVRTDRIGLIGHSHGGWTVMRAVQKRYGLGARGLRAAVAYYPSCAPQFDRDVDVPLLILIGDKDDWTPADRCRQLQAAGFARPELVDVVYYPDAYHSFDSRGADRTVQGSGGRTHRLAYDPAAAADAEARTKAFFERHLR